MSAINYPSGTANISLSYDVNSNLTQASRGGAVSFAAGADAGTYGVIDEIAGRALTSGARVLGVRRSDLPGGGDVAAILRFAV